MTKIKGEVLTQVETLRKAGHKPMFISKQCGLEYETVKKHFARSKRLAGLPPKIVIPKHYFQGRIPGIIKRYIEENPCALSEQIIAGCGLTCGRVSLERWMNNNGLSRTKAKRSIFLRDVNRVKRLEFETRMMLWTDEELNLILWTDETMVKAYPNGEQVFYRALQNRSDIISPVVQQGGSGQMLWGCVSYHAYGPLEAIEGHVTGVSYLKLLKDVVKPEMDTSRDRGRRLVYQQDNAKPHTTPAVLEFFENWEYIVLEWPPQSPDLSPIENIWNVMKMKMKALRPRPRTTATMRNEMMKIWDELEDELRVNIVGSFRERLKLCIAANGGLIKKF